MKTILTIEDNADLREISRATLTHRGYRVLEAASGAEGIDLARAERPDLILLDLGLPGMDGFATAETLRQLAETSRIPIVVVSAYGRAEDAQRALGIGVSAYLRKPVDPGKMADRIAAILGASEAAG